ncbi:sulfatase [Reichenbachiella carrageenanivorans]|uniref:Sulfatase n=1 Tax=Reichenbachiella carrageenanivorans TaxID=2979869 RepID=A0ABY6CYT2_9BACT|nr:sulfatase [Reichenbachiella carrageenanivorans]UXX79071.1 sulfatase [Reichenbachiella carrageenanivorans]
MKKANLLTIAYVLIVALSGCGSQKSAVEEQQPNVIFIFPDQFRNSSLGIWSQPGYDQHLQGNPDPVNTPALDKMAAEGVVFSQAVSNFPLCSPYRAMMLSGMYPDTNGATNNCRMDRESSLRSDVTAITDVFAQGGYNVSYFGKCHWLKNEPLFDANGTYHGTTDPPGGEYINRYDTYIPQGPDRHSIDYFCQVLKDVHFDPLVYASDPKIIGGKKDGELFYPKRFSAEFESENIINYLDNTHKQRDTEKPFFMIWSLNPPHNPWTEESTKMEYFDQYTDNGEVDLDRLLTHENADHEIGQYAPYYFANVSAVDYYIGLVLDKLEAMGIADNTIIVFSSDHGEMLGSHGKRGKNVPENESLNIPFVVKWGDKLKHRVEDLIMGAPDVLPTLVALAGMENRIPAEVQGTNYADVIKKPEENENKKPKAVLIMNYKTRGVFTGDYTFVVREDKNQASEIYCYDNKKDPNQLEKIAFEQLNSTVGGELKSSLERLLKQTNDRWYQEKVASNFLNYN